MSSRLLAAFTADDDKAYTRFSRQEWSAFIDAAEKRIPEPSEKFDAPEIGTAQLAKYIDHTLLKLDATEEQVDQLCKEAKEYNFKVGLTAALQWSTFVHKDRFGCDN